MVKNPPVNAGDTRNADSVSGLGRSPGRRHGNLLQCSYLENPTDREALQVIVHEITKSQTGLKQLNRTLTWLNMTSDFTTQELEGWLFTVKNSHITYRWPSISMVQHPGIQPVRTVSSCNIYYWKKFIFKWAWAVQTYVTQRPAIFEAGGKASRVGDRELSSQLNWPCFMQSQVVLWS